MHNVIALQRLRRSMLVNTTINENSRKLTTKFRNRKQLKEENLKHDCVNFVAYSSFYLEKATNALYELGWELSAICLPHQDGGIPLSAQVNLRVVLHPVPLMLNVKQGSCEYQL